MSSLLKETVSRDFLLQVFFMNHLPPVSTTPVANFATGTAGVVDTGGNLPLESSIINDTGGK
jgi:hypothetical protein